MYSFLLDLFGTSAVTEVKKLTPMMEQWESCKKAAGPAVLLFRMGDFYEAFYEDAEILSRELDLFLTKRQEIPMSGIPWHTVENYIERLVSKGYRLAIAEQIENPKDAKGLVKRKVVRTITPGTLVSASQVGSKESSYIASVIQIGKTFGLAYLDLTSSQLKVMEVDSIRELSSELLNLNPKEILTSEKFQDRYCETLKPFPCLTVRQESLFDGELAQMRLQRHFKLPHLDGFGLKGMTSAISAAGALFNYLHQELTLSVSHIKSISKGASQETLSLDATTIAHLELFEGKNALVLHLDKTLTPMGGRLLREWLKKPLTAVEKIKERQHGVSLLFGASLKTPLSKICDIERITMRIASNIATPRDYLTLRHTLDAIPEVKNGFSSLHCPLIDEIRSEIGDTSTLSQLLHRALVDEPPQRASEGDIFKEGYDPQLDKLRDLSLNGKNWLASYEKKLREETGIRTIKVGFNKIFGYSIEVSKGQASQVPDFFERRQTLANAERFSTPELKEYEEKILTAEEKKYRLEMELFQKLQEAVSTFSETLFSIAQAIGRLDLLFSFALLAKEKNYSLPLIDTSMRLEIVEGRHPIVEEVIGREYFISNDTLLDEHEKQMMIITGPNMAGKSTYIRQVALIVILAQIGSFVPAKKVVLGVVDKIFTRIGASDDLARGQSTFMVEMSETANILNNVTSRSLVILDEIGRGTSTFDGISIAWAIAEYLLQENNRKARTLFATHYFELTELEKRFKSVVNFHASVKEVGDDLVFLHKIAKGAGSSSYGLHVARLAGLPVGVIKRGYDILHMLEEKKMAKSHPQSRKDEQLSLF